MLKLNDVTWLYQHLPMRFTLSVERGERIAVLGPSGAGKSTLLNLIAGFLTPASGSIALGGQLNAPLRLKRQNCRSTGDSGKPRLQAWHAELTVKGKKYEGCAWRQ